MAMRDMPSTFTKISNRSANFFPDLSLTKILSALWKRSNAKRSQKSHRKSGNPKLPTSTSMSEKAKFTKLFATWRSLTLSTLKFKLMKRTSKLFPITTWSKSSLNSVSPVTKRMKKRRRETLKIKVKKKKW